jgi:hypothetical protein
MQVRARDPGATAAKRNRSSSAADPNRSTCHLLHANRCCRAESAAGRLERAHSEAKRDGVVERRSAAASLAGLSGAGLPHRIGHVARGASPACARTRVRRRRGGRGGTACHRRSCTPRGSPLQTATEAARRRARRQPHGFRTPESAGPPARARASPSRSLPRVTGGVAQLYYGRLRARNPLRRYLELDAPVNHISLRVAPREIARICRGLAFDVVARGRSYRNVPDGYRGAGGEQASVTLVKR